VRIEQLVLRRSSPEASEHIFDFEEGWNVFWGGNETGKTSLVDALLTVFFGPPADSFFSRVREVELELAFRTGDVRYRLTRNLAMGELVFRRQDGPGNALLFEGNAGEGEGAVRYRSVLLDVIGFDTPEAWLRAGLVRDGALKVQKSSGDASASDKGSRVLSIVPPPEEAPEPTLDDRITEVRAEVAEREDQALSAEAVMQNLSRFEQLSEERNRLEDRLLELRAERDLIRRDVEEVERQEARLEEHFGNFLDAPTDIQDRMVAWTRALAVLEEREQALAEAQEAYDSLPVLHSRRNALFGGLLLAFAAWEYGAVTGDLMMAALLYPGGVMVGLGIGGLLDVGRRMRRHKVEAGLQECRVARDQATFEEVRARTDLGRLSRFNSPSELQEAHGKYLAARAQVEETRQARSHNRALGEVMNAYEDVFSELQVLDTQTRDLIAHARYLSGCDHSPEILAAKLEEARQGLADAEQAAEEARRMLETLEEERAQTHPPSPPEEAGTEPASASQGEGGEEPIPASVSDAFSALTGNRYQEVRPGSAGEPEVRAEEGWSAIHTLSRETRDQLQFVLRLARHKEVEPNLRPPVVLDDAFLGWDEERLDQAHSLLDDLVAAGGQIIVMSSDPRVAAWIASPVDLGNPVAGLPRIREAA
jgi:DNA repair exonuclease SbcCD ATPase subunit